MNRFLTGLELDGDPRPWCSVDYQNTNVSNERRESQKKVNVCLRCAGAFVLEKTSALSRDYRNDDYIWISTKMR